MILIEKLVAGYRAHQVLHGVSLELHPGRVHGLVGLNGSGKTTLLRCIYGLKRARSGAVIRDGKPFSRKNMSFLETESYFYHGITGKEYLSLFGDDEQDEFNADGWSEMFHLSLDTLVDAYSTGMKKKLALLGVIRSGKSLLLLDEPFNGLDLESSRVLMAVISKLRSKGRTILLTSHILGTLTEVCDSIHHIHEGRIMNSYLPGDADSLEHALFTELDERIGDKIDKLI